MSREGSGHCSSVPGRRWTGVLLLLLIAALFWSCDSRTQSPGLPELPQIVVIDELPSVAASILSARRKVLNNPQDPAANGQLGMLLHAHGKLESAVTCYERARLLDPNVFRWLYFQAWALAELGEPHAAIDGLRNALELDPAHVRAQLTLAELFLHVGELAESRLLYERVTRDHADRVDAHYGFGQLLLRQGDSESAIRQFHEALKQGGHFGSAHYALSRAYREQGDGTAATHHLTLFQKHRNDLMKVDDPLRGELERLRVGDSGTSPVARINNHVARAVQLLKAGRVPEAVAEYEGRPVEDARQDALFHANLIDLYGQLGKIREAEEHFEKSLAIDPNLAKAHFNLGMIRLKARRFGDAEAAFQRAAQIDPNDPETRSRLGFALEQQGQGAAGLEQYRAALAIDPDHRTTHSLMGQRFMRMNQMPAAMEHLQKATAKKDWRTPFFLRLLAVAYHKSGQDELAVTTLTRARQEVAKTGDKNLAALIQSDLNKLRAMLKQTFPQP